MKLKTKLKVRKLIGLNMFIFLGIGQSVYASGIPVIDAAAIAQAVQQYTQSLKEYEQMVKDTLNFEKQMKELGVDMDSISDILGNVRNMVRDTQNLYNDIVAIPDDFYGEIEDITRACSFLENESTFFKMKINRAGTKYTDKINSCITSISDGVEISQTIEDLSKKAQSATDPTTFKKIQIEIENLQNAKEYLASKNRQDKINRMVSFYDNYQKNEVNNPYTKVKMDNDLRELSNQLSKPNNAKQAQALSNAILLKMLEMSQRQYELNLNFSNAMTSFNAMNMGQDTHNLDYQKTYVETINPEEFNPFYQNIDKNLSKDEFGLPIYDIK